MHICILDYYIYIYIYIYSENGMARQQRGLTVY